MICQLAITGMNASLNNLKIKANAADLEPTAMYAATGIGAPSYVSGAHMWKGTAATLKPSPATSISMPTITPGEISDIEIIALLISS